MGGLALSIVLLAVGTLVWVTSAANTMSPQGIIIHHSSRIPTITSAVPLKEYLPTNVDTIDEFHRRRGFGAFYWGRVYHIGYHYVIFPDGSIRQGRPENCVGAHAKGFNDYLGIVLVGDFSSKHTQAGTEQAQPTAEQMRSLVLLIRALRRRYNIPLDHIIRHRDIARTDCPGDRFPYLQLLQQIH